MRVGEVLENAIVDGFLICEEIVVGLVSVQGAQDVRLKHGGARKCHGLPGFEEVRPIGIQLIPDTFCVHVQRCYVLALDIVVQLVSVDERIVVRHRVVYHFAGIIVGYISKVTVYLVQEGRQCCHIDRAIFRDIVDIVEVKLFRVLVAEGARDLAPSRHVLHRQRCEYLDLVVQVLDQSH